MASDFMPAAFHENRPGLFAPVRLDPTGVAGPTRTQARGPDWRRTGHGLYLPADLVADRPEQRIVEAAAALPSYGGITGWAALRWSGGRWFDGLAPGGTSLLPVCLATGGKNVRDQAGYRVCEEKLDPRDLDELDGLRITSNVRSVCFEMRYAANLRMAVQVFGMAAYNDLVSLDEMVAYALAHPAWTGQPQCRKALGLGEENWWSPMEVQMVMTWIVDAGFPRPLCNVPIFDRAGRHLGTPDLLDPEAGVVGEYDGSLHLQGAQRSRDVRRENLFRAAGLEYFTMLAGDNADRGLIVDRMTTTRARAKWLPESQRPWTITPPPWWTPTVTVQQRRALTEDQRARLLRHRALVDGPVSVVVSDSRSS